ncbi:TetR family transcriptional regulator [Streptomyces sp. NPDC090499]|uniref:TetR family transcriptional regulator n=1 Tax=unclassified Streptomyces TaxID=2593676 RepID=UPI0038271733
MTDRPSLGQLKRQLVRDQLTESAMRLLAQQGLEATTAEQIAAEVGVSRRTFFRYFDSKEDVIVQAFTEAGNALCAELSARLTAEGTAMALRQTIAAFVQKMTEHPEKTLRLTRLVLDSPGLRARFLERQAQWQTDMAAVLSHGSSQNPVDLRPALASGVALTAFYTALTRWSADGGARDLAELVDEAFDVVTPALDVIN